MSLSVTHICFLVCYAPLLSCLLLTPFPWLILTFPLSITDIYFPVCTHLYSPVCYSPLLPCLLLTLFSCLLPTFISLYVTHLYPLSFTHLYSPVFYTTYFPYLLLAFMSLSVTQRTRSTKGHFWPCEISKYESKNKCF